jgi:hypothetical protein
VVQFEVVAAILPRQVAAQSRRDIKLPLARLDDAGAAY